MVPPSHQGRSPPTLVLFSLFVFATLLAPTLVNCQYGPTVQTNTLYVQGAYLPVNQTVIAAIGLPTTNITQAEVYWGVPFAQAPVGSLRFEKPQAVAAYTGATPLNCTTPQNFPFCHTNYDNSILSLTGALTIPISEDCLRLTIVRPAGINCSANLPVLVYLFGGGFVSSGGVQMLPPWDSGAPDLYISQSVIFVVVQYRQAILGFGSDGTSDLPGNYGLFDQQLALQWIYNNIGAFGGDNSQITLWGSSAGSASTGYHTIQPNSSSYFQRAFQDSGSVNSPWASGSTSRSVSATLAVANAVNCSSGSTLKSCLQSVPMATLQAAAQNYPSASQPGAAFNFELFAWGPIYDGDFFYADFETMITAASPMPNVFGFTTDEGAKFLPTVVAAIPGYTLSGINLNSTTLSMLINATVQPSDPSNSVAVAQIGAIRSAIYNFYATVDSQANATASYFYYMQMIRFTSDVDIIIPALWESRLKAQLGWPVYIYHWDFCNAQQWESALYSKVYPTLYPYPVCQHASMFPYEISSHSDLNYPAPAYWNRTSTDYAIQSYLVGSLLSFVSDGTPNPQWPQANYTGHACSGSSQYSAVNINIPSPSLESGTAENAIRLGFWDTLCAQYDCSLVLGFPKTMGQCTNSTSSTTGFL